MDAYLYFASRLQTLSGLDILLYREEQMKRRLQDLCRLEGFAGLQELADRLEDLTLRKKVMTYLTINVSEFFRNPSLFNRLKEVYLPTLLKQNHPLRILSAGSSNGCEAYSLAIFLNELGVSSFEIIGIDFDRDCVLASRFGVYKEEHMKNVSPDRLQRYFTVTSDQNYQINPEIKKNVHYRQGDLLAGRLPKETDLILCRNVMIYFSEEAKNLLFQKFNQALKPGGYLFLGATETLFQSERFGLKAVGPFFYQKGQDLSIVKRN